MATMLPTGMLPGLLSPEQEAAVAQQARQNALLNFGLQALAGSQAVGYRPGTLQVLGQAGQSALQSYQGTFDQQLQNMLRQQQLADAQRKRQAEAQRQQELETYISGLPEAEQARFRAFPTQAAEAMFREQPEQFVQLTPEQAAARGLPANKTFQMSSKTGRVTEIGGGGTTVKVGGERDPFDVDVAKKQAAVFSQLSDSGTTATSNLRRIDRLENTLNRIETGGAAAFKQIAGNFGINISKDLPDIQAAEAIINSLVPAQRPPGSGPMSDADLDLFKKSLPRIINQPGGNKLIVDGMRDINRYMIEQSKIANEVLAKRITPDEGRRMLLELGNPIDDFFEKAQGSQPTQTLPEADQALIDKYKNKVR